MTHLIIKHDHQSSTFIAYYQNRFMKKTNLFPMNEMDLIFSKIVFPKQIKF